MKTLIELREFSLYALLFAIISTFLAAKFAKRNKKNGKRPPEVAGSWPVIGHLHLLGGRNQLLHKTLGAMADKYGPIFSIRLGTNPAIVVSDREIVKECFTTNDRVFSTRPKFLALKIMGYNQTLFGFAPYGRYWRDIRKLVMVELLSGQRLELLEHVRDSETSLLMKELYDKSSKNGGQVIVEVKKRLADMAIDIIVRMISGKRYFSADAKGNQETKRCQETVRNFFYLAGLNLVSDAVPMLGWLDSVRGFKGTMKRTARELDSMLGSWVKEHRRIRLNGSINEEEKDFIHVMLSTMDDSNISADEADTTVKATCLSLLTGGSGPTAVALIWPLALLLNNRSVLKKAQDELDTHVGKHRQVAETDIKNLVYLQAIVKETFRLHPSSPLSAAREAMEDCTVAGFHIPAGTRLLVNLWKLHRDPNIWADPLEFQPERFLKEHANLDVGGQDFEFTPFGSGRRACPAVTFAVQVVHLTLARLLHGFELRTVSDTPVDMTESPGLTVPKAAPLEVVLRPRLPPVAYEF
uniref:Cytochrome P450 n=2 Tax=Salix viminalis TaxID=40686 RepID=A0A6N2LEE7_SALVM